MFLTYAERIPVVPVRCSVLDWLTAQIAKPLLRSLHALILSHARFFNPIFLFQFLFLIRNIRVAISLFRTALTARLPGERQSILFSAFRTAMMRTEQAAAFALILPMRLPDPLFQFLRRSCRRTFTTNAAPVRSPFLTALHAVMAAFDCIGIFRSTLCTSVL